MGEEMRRAPDLSVMIIVSLISEDSGMCIFFCAFSQFYSFFILIFFFLFFFLIVISGHVCRAGLAKMKEELKGSIEKGVQFATK